ATWPVVALGVKFINYVGQELIEKLGIIAPAHLMVIPLITYMPLLNFVITAPEGDAWVMAQMTDIVLYLGTDIFHERLVESGVGGTSEHEILPDANAEFIAKVIEYVSLVDTAAPDAKHIHVCLCGVFEEMGIIIICKAGCKRVGGNPVCTFGKEWNTVYNKLE
ncbi:unnamed protein product, partial [marine sediment metagenome]